ncbi:MAG: restriction endonuclease subunit S, partial [Ignavibacteria bacterium]|nr:restriction endonuclease subunit S [Ignavibacteria bacterium]
MENNIPASWVECSLGEVCSKPQYGWTSKAGQTGEIKYLRTTDISDGELNWKTVPFCIEEPGESEKFQVKKNDILVSRAGSVGFNFRIKEDIPFKAVFASYLIRFKAYDDVTAKLIDYFLKSENYWKQISDFTLGIAIPNVNATKLEELKIPLPPLAEQHRIVAKLDSLFAKTESNKQRLEKIP